MEQQLNEMIDALVNEVAQGLLLKNAKLRLVRNGASDALASKISRIIEIRAGELSHYAVR